MTHTANKITDEPHLIGTCSGGKLVVFDGLDCRITINGESALDAASEIKKCVNLHEELLEVLDSVLEGIKLGYNLGYLGNEVEEALKKAGAI